MKSQEEQQICCALVGLKCVLVGGDPRPKAVKRLESVLGFSEVIHCATRKGDASASRFVTKLRTARLVLVICARGLTRTQHGADLHVLCRKFGVPLLDFNHIPHPNAVVPAIMNARLTRAVVDRSVRVKRADVIGGAA